MVDHDYSHSPPPFFIVKAIVQRVGAGRNHGTVRFLVLHGYLLRGTGSNVYNAQLAPALARAGHEVHLLSQEPRPLALPWVDAEGTWDGGGGLRVRARREPVRITAYRPPIGRMLPVYVADRYEGFDARPLAELTDAQVEDHLARTVAAVGDVAARVRPQGALANHLVLSPAALARAGLAAAVKVHGSALEYVVKPHPRFLPWAQEGLAGATAVLVGSRHTAESLWATMEDPALPARTRLGPPGVDVERFGPRGAAEAAAGLRRLVARLAWRPPEGEGAFARDPAEAAVALSGLDPEREPLVAYVGKLLSAKGVDLLLDAWPAVLERVPAARLVVVGFGEHRGALQAAAARRGLLGGPVRFTGRLEHDELADLLPACRAQAVPSVFPEAFGMVAAEAAAAGVVPVVAGHSGLAEIAEGLAGAVPEPARAWLTFPPGPGAAAALAARLVAVLRAPPDLLDATRDGLVECVRARYSWDGVARGVAAASQGDLDALPEP
ncbi:MAG TPA: glycosyltransferase [Solirubrobacteraceae bacterium]|nr:glycosyltransferase [Solirubrobacteraceae bacterium]